MGNAIIHFEILGADAERTATYYEQLFGWNAKPLPFDNPTDYRTIEREDVTNAEGVGIGGGLGAAPEGYAGHVTFYVEVPDVAASLEQAEQLGGQRVMGPDQVPGGPLIAQFTDPDGHVVGLVQEGT
jgi:uncharacterized protein